MEVIRVPAVEDRWGMVIRMKKVIAYVGTKDILHMREEDVQCLDVINIAFGQLQECTVIWKDENGVEAIQRLRQLKPDIKVLLSIGGWGADGFSDAAATRQNREKTAQSTMEIIEKYGLDGVDIDWEYPGFSLAGIRSRAEDGDNFVELLRLIREQMTLTGEERMLTIAAGGDTYFTRQVNMKAASQYLDYVQLMTYDLQGGFQKVTGHHTSLYMGYENLFDVCVDKAVRAFAEAGVPAEKLVIGVAYYSRMWKGVSASESGLGMEAQTVGTYGPDYGELAAHYIDQNGYRRYWDDSAKAPYLYNGDTFISYDDRESIACKVEYVKEKKLCGLMFWEYCCDTTGTLTKHIRERMDA